MEKVLFVANVYRHLSDFHTPYLMYLKNQNCEVYALANEDYGGFKEKLEDIGVKCIDAPINRNPVSIDNWTSFKIIRNVIKINEFKFIHVHTPVAAFLTRLANIDRQTEELIYSVHGFHFFKGSPLKNWLLYFPLELINVKNTDTLITTNIEDTIIANKMGFKKSSITHIKGVGVDIGINELNKQEKDKLKDSLNIKPHQVVITYIAEANTNKNQMFLLRNWKYIKKATPNAVLLFAGQGPKLQEYIKYAEINNLKDVQFLGYRKDIPSILQITDILTLLSYREGLPKSIMEGMSNGIPCIVSNTRGLVDLIENNVNGYIVKKNDDMTLIKKFIKLIKNDEERNKFGKNNKEKIKDFSIESVIKDYAEVYKKR